METKFRVGNKRYIVDLIEDETKYYLKFDYNAALVEEVKNFEGAKWSKERYTWTFPKSFRNEFVLELLREGNPYAKYDEPLVDVTFNRKLYEHQKEMVRHGLTRHYALWAAEMGTGKSLAAIELIERVNPVDCWYIGPKSGVVAFRREIQKWGSSINPRLYTYEGLTKVLEHWTDGCKSPQVVIFDESSKIKTPTAKRSKAAYKLADAVRTDWGNDGYVILMSGSPAPKSPCDWWHQVEITRPGFFKEGNIFTFKRRLCLLEERQSITGGVYPHLVTWLDSEDKCAICGKIHTDRDINDFHQFTPSINEVNNLYKRMRGLVLVQFKKDCLSLPEKQYRIIDIPPSAETMRLAKLITTTSGRAIEALTLLRELSDGFQYNKEEAGMEQCTGCGGSGRYRGPVSIEPSEVFAPQTSDPDDYQKDDEEIICDNCGGTGKAIIYKRGVQEMSSPKDQVFLELLEDHEDIGRFVVWGGFTATIDRLVAMCHQNSWSTLRVDGRGFLGEDPKGNIIPVDTMLDCMDGSSPNKLDLFDKYPKVCFVGNSAAGGMALTLTSSPTALYYSNSFNGEARIQSEDRIHRIGCDPNRGATIIDLIHLKTDNLVLENLKKKKKLQHLTMAELAEVL